MVGEGVEMETGFQKCQISVEGAHSSTVQAVPKPRPPQTPSIDHDCSTVSML